ncbi:hypothetical protein GCM10023189_52690 [Nibrella saemangeumensis]|uniref:Thioredoxin domain-containing protein n=1 Tax=Nibrella saemangeumensis TaxID=1084526 RepID=A0ABP8NIW8_9BACT
MKKLLFWTVLTIGLPIACTSDQPVSVKSGTWRAVLKTAGGELPFGLDIQPNADGKTYTVFALTANERLKMDTATVQNDSLRIPMGIFESELVAKVTDNQLQGIWRKRRTGNDYQILPFEAQHGVNYRFAPNGQPAKASVSGKWATLFRAVDSKDTTLAVGVFDQQGDKLTGTFLTPTGDYRYLQGNVYGDSLFLSTFDGNHAYLFKAKQQPDGSLSGTFRSGATYVENWTARLDPNATLPNPATLTYLKPGNKTISFRFPDATGKVVSSNDERFKNKVVILQILGSWCPNCMDETNFLSPWYQKNRQRGVEVVGLAFEKSADLTESAPKLQRMVNRFNVDYPVVLAGTNDKAEASKALPALNRVVAFPTTIFLDKKGNVRHIHTGFSGPGTGKYYDEYVEEFNRLVDKLLAE